MTHGLGLHCPCRGSVSSYPASICGRTPMRRGRPPCRTPSSRSPAIPASRGSLSKSKQPSLRRAMRSGSMGSLVTGSLTTRLRSAALRLTAEIRHDFGRPPGSNVTRRSPGTTRQVSVRPLRGSRSGRSADGRIQNGALRRLGDGAVAGALDLPDDVLRGDAEVRGTGRIEGCGEEIGSTEPFLPPGCKREQRFVVPALGERAMPLEWNQQAHSEALESFSDVGR